MKLAGNVQVTHRLNPTASASRPRWSNLAIGKDPSSGDLYMSCVNNITNTKYKIMGNVEQVFMKFIARGLATIRFKEPYHDVSINCKDNAEGLKSFLIALRQVLQNKPITVPLLAQTPTGSIIQKAKTSMTITERSAYPVLNGFPSTLENLSVSLQMERFDRRIVRLIHLKTLNLSENRISVLPKELGELPCLSTLILSGNQLGKVNDEEDNWAWMDSMQMSSNLHDLDLTANELQMLPFSFNNLRSLVSLKLDKNDLTSLPQIIGTFCKLKQLSLGGNRLPHLPGSILRLHLESIDISGNPFVNNTVPSLPNQDAISSPPSLFEEAARTIVNKRIYYPKHIPKILQNYLYSAMICHCGSACFESRASMFTTIDVNRVSPIVLTGKLFIVSQVPAEMHFCSKKCFILMRPRGTTLNQQLRGRQRLAPPRQPSVPGTAWGNEVEDQGGLIDYVQVYR